MTNPLPSVDDIRVIDKNEHEEDVIMMARNESNYLDNLSLEGDIRDNLSDK
jgi:hypothetical protein